MNQILKTNDYDDENIIKKSEPSKKILFLRWQLSISVLTFSLLLFYNLYINYQDKKINSLSDTLLSNYNISLLYMNKQADYSANRLNSTPHIDNDNKYHVIGIIQINKINITYPILSETSDKLLKISLCRFVGPDANKIGNLCIVGHNYRDSRCFSRLNELKTGDTITIYDLFGEAVDYNIYDSFEILDTDMSCTSQETTNKREVTLITCNSIKEKRFVVKAREK